VADTGTLPGPQRAIFSSRRPYEVLAAKNATLRLRAASGHVFSFTDLTCANGAVNFGHLNPAIDPFTNLASDLAYPFYPPSAAAHAEWLCEKLRLDAHTLFYQVGERSAVDLAVAIGRRNRPGKILIVDGSSHEGLGHRGLGHGLRVVHGDAAEDARAGECFLRIAPGSEFNAWDDVSCLLYEPIQGDGDYVPLPLPWLRGLSQSAQAAGVVVIADEIQCGFFRFGRLSLAASEFLHPDIYLFGNSMTNGIYPLFAVVCPESLRSAFPDEEDGCSHTFQPASLGFQAAEAVAKYIDSTDIEGLVAQLHSILSQAGERLAANSSLSAFHLAGPTLSLEVRDEGAGALIHGCEERCILVGSGGRGRVRVAPPITIPPEQLSGALKILEQVAAGL
jgi:acetylornithine/succinyldiaminopimelate/putrescine aminotransferase